MLLDIREKAQGWFAWIIVAFITIPFALWGIQSYLGVGKEPVMASVNGEEITQRQVDQETRRLRERLRAQLGTAYRPEMFTDKALRKQVIEQLIDQAVLRQAADDWHLRAGDELVRQFIRSIPAFQRNGHFDVQAYDIAVRNQGLSQRGFEESVRADLVLDQLQRGIVASALATDREVNEFIRLRDQQRKVSWLRVRGQRLLQHYTPSQEELRNYYQEHKARWKVPERVKVEYLLLDPETVGAGIKVTDEALRDYWRQHQSEFMAPEERRVRHILIAVPENADPETVAKAKARAEAVYRRLQQGEEFAKVAREASDDPGSKEQGGDLGWISPGLMPKKFEEVAYSLKKGVVSKPVRTSFGFHILQVTDIKAGGKATFEKLRDRIEAAYRRQEAERLIYDKAEKLADLTYENPDDLNTAAEALGLKIQESDWFDRRGGKGPLASPKVVAAAFSEDVLDEGHNSELIELDEDRVLVLRVVEHEAEQVLPFDKVKERVRQALLENKAAELARQRGEKLVQEVRQGATLAAVAERDGWTLKPAAFLARDDSRAPTAVVKTAFTLPRPEKGKVSAGGAPLEGGDYAVLAVSEVKDGDPSRLDDQARKQEAAALARRKGLAQYKLLVRFLRDRAKVETSEEP